MTSQEARDQHVLVDALPSNSGWAAGRVTATYRETFEILAEVAEPENDVSDQPATPCT